MAAPALSFGDRFRAWVRAARRDVTALWLAGSDPRVPWYAKAMAVLVAAYALSPIDLIPDAIPVLGYLDDALLVPLGIWLTVRMIPADVMADLRTAAQRRIDDPRPRSRLGLALVFVTWVLLGGLCTWWLWRWLGG